MPHNNIEETKRVYAERGYLVMASVDKLNPGPITRNDWEESEMTDYKWRVIATATREELEEQNRLVGWDKPVWGRFRYFYKIEAMD